MSGQAAYLPDDFELRQTYDPTDIQEATTCDWCDGELPEGAFTFCCELCAVHSRLDAMGDGA